jgi:hypothetical protein
MIRRMLFAFCLLAVVAMSGCSTSACWNRTRQDSASTNPCYYTVPAWWGCCTPCYNEVYCDPGAECCSDGRSQMVVTELQTTASGCMNCRPAADVKPSAKLQPIPQPTPGQ